MEEPAIAGEPKNLLDSNLDKTTTSPAEARTRISQPPPPARPASQVGSQPGGVLPVGSQPGDSRAGSVSGEGSHISVEVGDLIDNKYRVEELIGQGGMGQVLGATHLELHQKVALKFMSPAIMEIPGAVARFTREARAAAKLRSKHVCRVLDIGETPEGAKYIVIEYLEGSDLSELLMIKEKLPSREAIDYIVQACDALGEAHEFDIVHRDIKPANLFLDSSREGEGLLKVLDFGISKNLGNDPDMIVTATNALMGSPLYMSPEQLLTPKKVDTRADIWSLGIVLHELLVGKPPFQGETLPEVIALIVNQSRKPADAISEDIPAELRTIIAKCLERDPVRRYRTAEQLADALRAVAPESASVGRKGHALETAAITAAKPSLPWKRISVAGAAVALAAVLFFVMSGGDSKPKAPKAPAANSIVPAKSDVPLTRDVVVPSTKPAVAPDAQAAENSEVVLGEGVTKEGREPTSTAPQVAAESPNKRESRSKSKPKSSKSKGKASQAKSQGAKRSKPKGNGAKEGLMDPSDEGKGSRAPGDDDVMDPEL